MKENRKRLTGVVTSDKMDKTVVVSVEMVKRHPIYAKTMRLSKKYKAHDENNDCKIGDTVSIMEVSPISRHKRWAVTEIVERAV